LQIALDRGQNEDWFDSSFIRLMAVLATVGILGAIAWLLVARRPVVDLHVFKDRNFSVACLCISATGAVLYAGAIVIPQFTQTLIGYDATWSGLVLSPGAVLVIFLIPLVGQLLSRVQTRLLIFTGFVCMGAAFFYSSQLTTQIDFRTLMLFRTTQTVGLAFLFVPISTIAFANVPRELNGDATALFVMLRNVFGSIGISVASSMILRRGQVHQAYLSEWASPLHQPFNELVGAYERALIAMGRTAAAAHGEALGRVYRMYAQQAETLGYGDVFLLAGVVAFVVAPFCFLFTARKGGGKAAAAH